LRPLLVIMALLATTVFAVRPKAFRILETKAKDWWKIALETSINRDSLRCILCEKSKSEIFWRPSNI